jgi:pimeloyl-ACP methyl ester carboxylesterase
MAASVKAMASHMPNLEVMLIPGANHFTVGRQPEFVAGVVSFLG